MELKISFLNIIKQRIKENLRKSEEKLDYKDFIRNAFTKTCIISLSLLIVFYLLYDLQVGFGIFALSFLLIFAGKIVETEKNKRKYAEKLEAELPFVLMELAVLIDLGIDFGYAISKIAGGNYGALSKEYKKIEQDMEKGKGLEEGLRDFNQRQDSVSVERANSVLAGAYSKGNRKSAVQSMKMLADELLVMQKISSKEYNGKLVVYSLMFIVVSAILPALFQSFLIAGTMVFRIDFSPLETFLIICGLFPLANILMLFYIRGKTPVHLQSLAKEKTKGQIKAIEKEIESFKEILGARKTTLRKFFKKYFLLGTIVSLSLFLAGMEITSQQIPVFFLFLPASLFIGYFIENYLYDRKKLQKEKRIAEVLLQASIFPKGTDTLEIIRHLGQANTGEMKEEFRKALREIEKGASINSALYNIKKRCKSRTIDRAIDLLIAGYENGADMSSVFRDSAEDIIKSREILMERNASMIVEKYTLLFAGALLVPMVLGFLSTMVSGMDIGSNFLLQAEEIAQKKELLEIIGIASLVYIIEYSILASVFVALQENQPKKSVFYILIVLPLSLTAYFLASLFI